MYCGCCRRCLCGLWRRSGLDKVWLQNRPQCSVARRVDPRRVVDVVVRWCCRWSRCQLLPEVVVDIVFPPLGLSSWSAVSPLAAAAGMPMYDLLRPTAYVMVGDAARKPPRLASLCFDPWLHVVML